MNNQLGCFGSVLYHDAESRRCSVCPFLETCKQEVVENKTKLESWYKDLVASNKTTRKSRKMVAVGSGPIAAASASPARAATTTSEPLVNAEGQSSSDLNKKPREFVERWTQKGIAFKAYKEGVNGFELCGNKFAAVAMRFFMDNPGGVTKLQLTDELVAKCGARGQGWGLGTAASHAGIAIEAFEYLGIIHQVSGKVYLR